MTEVIIKETAIDAGEPYFIVYVDKPKGVGQSVVATLEMGLIGPVTPEKMTPRRLTGFELPALELIHKAEEHAREAGVRKILLVDSEGLLPLAKVNRYERD